MDYIFGSTIKDSELLEIDISYDVSCQWFINVLQHIISQWSEQIKLNPWLVLRPLIPKLHEPGHQKAGHEEFSFNFAPGVGLMDGECPECIWVEHNALRNATKTQGPGSRHDVLDDHFGFWNWLKYSSMGKHNPQSCSFYSHLVVIVGSTLMGKYKAAIQDRNIQVEAHRGLTATIPLELVMEWETMCHKWDADSFPKKARSPYQHDSVCKYSFIYLSVSGAYLS
jgi:hypothetical protein